ncbi:MAG TPA: portal protein [Acidimicrobiia bacterium]
MRKNESKRQYHDRRLTSLKSMRNPWEAHWMELSENTAPARLRLSLNENEGRPSRKKIVDSTGTFALRTLASGMHSGITSPARPWFRLSTFDPDLKDYAPVKEYLAQVETRMREVYQSSNIYNAFHWGYGDLGLFGQSAAILVEDEDKVVRMIPMLHGSFWIARDHRGTATTLYRQFSWTVERIVARFGYDNCSNTIRNCYDKGDYDERFTINHAIEPRMERQAGKIDRKNKPILSNYWEDGGKHAVGANLLEESGFDSNPIIAPPWELVAEDSYGVSPGMDALPDIKALQVMQMRAGEAIDKKVRPPMTGPVSMKNNPASLMPGSVTYVDDPTGRAYRAAIEVNLSLTELENKIMQTQSRIDRSYYADLFLMLANMEGIQPRNTMEIAERKEEKLLALGPVLENIYGGQLAPVIDRTYEVMESRGLLPPPPPELQGSELKIEYISMLAQAQKAISTGSIERLFSFAGNLAAVNPSVLDKIDMDEGVDIYGDLLGAPPSIIVPDEDVSKIRDARAKQAQQAAQAEQMAQAAPAVKQGADAARVLSETDAGGNGSLLSQLGIG